MAALASNLQALIPSVHHFNNNNRNLSSRDGSINSLDADSNGYDRESPGALLDQTSCCSDDTVLSVGNEEPEQAPSAGEVAIKAAPSTEQLSFKNIENHLNALSKLANSNLAAESKVSPSSSPSMMQLHHRLSPATSIKSLPDSPSSSCSTSMKRCSNPTSPMADGSSFSPLFRQNLCSPSTSPNLSESPTDQLRLSQHERMQLQHQYFYAKTNNNDVNSGNLKFSIDNILKADFGRRITDPINIRKSRSMQKKSSLEGEKSATCVRPVDLTKSDADVKLSSAKPTVTSVVSASGTSISAGESPTGLAPTTASGEKPPMLWPAWVYCTRYSDRPSSGRSPRTRRVKKPSSTSTSNTSTKPHSSSSSSDPTSDSCPTASNSSSSSADEKRPRTAFSGAQLARLKHEFAENRYLTERRRQQLSGELGLNEAQIKIWFQNKRAKIKKASGQKNPLALQLMAQGLYNHSTIPLSKEEEELQELHAQGGANAS